jgi:ABC-type amino acid transport substrate-binding protein
MAHHQVTLGILTIVGSGVVSALVTHRLNAQKTRQDLLRQKLEKLFSTIQTYGAIQATSLQAPLAAMKGKTTFDEVNKFIDRFLQDERYHATARKCEILISLYFPRVRPTWQTWEQKRKTIVNLYKEYASTVREGQSVDDLANPYKQALDEFWNYKGIVESELAKLSPELIQPEPLIPWRRAWRWLSAKARRVFKGKDQR